jgi:hypothetical protein
MGEYRYRIISEPESESPFFSAEKIVVEREGKIVWFSLLN